MTPHAVMIFAAGLGTRMGDLTRNQPKPLIKVGSQALIDHALALAAEVSPNIVVNTHYRGDMLASHLAGQNVKLSDESDLLRETGGGLRHALPLLGEGPVWTLNSDAVWRGPNPLAILDAAWDATRMEALLLLLDPSQAVGHTGAGDFIPDNAGLLTRGPGVVYSGAQIIRTETLGAIPDPVFSLNRVWDQMAARGTLFGVTYPGQWCDVGRPESLRLAEALLATSDA